MAILIKVLLLTIFFVAIAEKVDSLLGVPAWSPTLAGEGPVVDQSRRTCALRAGNKGTGEEGVLGLPAKVPRAETAPHTARNTVPTPGENGKGKLVLH